MNVAATCFQKPENFFLKRIIFLVSFFHLFFLIFLSFGHSFKEVKKNQKKIAVHTVKLDHTVKTLPKKTEAIVDKAQVVYVEPVASIKKEITKKIETPKKRESVKKEKPVKKITPKKEIREVKSESPPIKKQESSVIKEIKKQESKDDVEKKEKQKALLSQARNNLLKTTLTKSEKTTATTSVVGLLSFEQNDVEINDSFWKLGYRDELAARLQSLLKFPEKGQVKIKLTLERSGKVLKIFIESFGSKKNKEYIEKTVKNLNFPSFQGDFNEFSEYTFSITLKG